MVGNAIYDPATGKEFTFEGPAMDTDPVWWGDHLPLWTTATHQGLRVSVRYFIACDVPFNVTEEGVTALPERCLPVRSDAELHTVPALADNLADAVTDLADGMDLVYVYSSVVDHTGHVYGPDSQEVRDVVKVRR